MDTVNWHDLSSFPALSTAVKTTVVVVSAGNLVPDGGIDVILAIPEASVAVGSSQDTDSDNVPGLTVTTISVGQFWTTGGMSSSTINENILLTLNLKFEVRRKVFNI